MGLGVRFFEEGDLRHAVTVDGHPTLLDALNQIGSDRVMHETLLFCQQINDRALSGSKGPRDPNNSLTNLRCAGPGLQKR